MLSLVPQGRDPVDERESLKNNFISTLICFIHKLIFNLHNYYAY